MTAERSLGGGSVSASEGFRTVICHSFLSLPHKQMKTLNGKRSLFPAIASAVVLTASMTGCGLMHDDLEDCATRPDTHTSVKFVYDYNTQTKDMFNDHVGAVTLYVFDANGNYVTEVEKANSSTSDALKNKSFQIDLSLKPGVYTLYAIAQGHQSGYQASLQEPGAKFRRTPLAAGDPFGSYFLNLDHNNGLVVNQGQQLDTHWTTNLNQTDNNRPVTLVVPQVSDPIEGDKQEEDKEVTATVPLMRVTNHLTISFWQTDFSTKIDPSHYDIQLQFPQGNSKLDLQGTTYHEQTITYTPLRTWTDSKNIDGNQAASVYAEFSFPRMMLNSNTRIVITNRNTGHVSTLDYVPRLLAKGKEAWDPFSWGEQEYLDREYEYSLDFPLGDPIPKWVQVNVNILSWSKRIQHVDL